MNNIFSQQTLDELQVFLKTDLTKGLTNQQVAQRLSIHGFNQIKSPNKPTLLQQLKKQFQDFLVIVLLLATTINFSIGIWQGHKEEIFEGCFILVIVLSNAFLSIYYENKTQKVLSLIEKITALKVKVIRQGKHCLISVTHLVPGDLVILEAGDVVAADIRLIKTWNLSVDESLLTGESQAVLKNAQHMTNNNYQKKQLP